MRWFFASIVAFALFSSACNDVGSCPGKETITPGGACSGDSLECAYDLATPSPACDGTSTTIATSCVCTSGAWVCPSAVSCPSAGDDGGAVADGQGEEGGDDAADAMPTADATNATDASDATNATDASDATNATDATDANGQ
jgi:hypothetical protein